MKRYYFKDGTGYVVIGDAMSISRLYRTMDKKGFYPAFCGEPKFNPYKIYGLNYDYETETFMVLNSDTVLRIMVDEL